MELKISLLIILVLVNKMGARPQDDDYDYYDYPEDAAECSEFGDTLKYPEPQLRFSCVPESDCSSPKNVLTVKSSAFTPEQILDLKVASAEASTCKEPKNACCHKDNVILTPEKKCSDIDGYTCVGSIICGAKEFTDNNRASCIDADTRSTGMVCCGDADIIPSAEPCSNFEGRRCVPNSKCGGNKVSRRSGGVLGLQVAAADEAKCDNDSDICCSEKEITQECSDYAQDGYKCVSTCYDMPQDFPPPDQRKTIISPFLPKEAKCDRRGPSICCRRTEPLSVNVTEVDCESSGPGYECADFDTCNPKTFLAKKVTSTADLLFEEMNLIEANPSGGLTINTAKSPCKSPTKVCCQPLAASGPTTRGPTSSPKPVDVVPSLEPVVNPKPKNMADTLDDLFGTNTDPPPPEKYTNCGVHNRAGLKRGGVSVSFEHSNGKPVTSQEGEWPHTCLILESESERLVGGASLIAPKIVVTAAHIIGKYKPEELKVRCGEWDIAETESERYGHQDKIAKSISIHPLYTRGKSDNLKLYYDVGLVHTTEAFEFQPNVNTICLPDSVTEDNFSKDDCHTMGWGTFNEEEPVNLIQNYMKKVILNRYDFDQCQSVLRAQEETTNSFNLHESFICAGGVADKDVCKGDGGGPLVCQQQGVSDKFVLAGIISWGIGCGREGVPGVYASVRDALCFIDWDTKCKHGVDFIGHYDYNNDCSGWMDEVLTLLEDNSLIFKRQLKRAKQLKDSCGSNGISGADERSDLLNSLFDGSRK